MIPKTAMIKISSIKEKAFLLFFCTLFLSYIMLFIIQ
jgi:hypothetical protein